MATLELLPIGGERHEADVVAWSFWGWLAPPPSIGTKSVRLLSCNAPGVWNE